MSEQYRDIRKEINLTANELKQIEQLMRDNHYQHFSPFVRDQLLLNITFFKALLKKRESKIALAFSFFPMLLIVVGIVQYQFYAIKCSSRITKLFGVF